MNKTTLYASTFCLLLNGMVLHAQKPNNGLSHVMNSQEKAAMATYKSALQPSAIPPQPARSIAEFEPNEAVTIAYVNGWGLPMSLIKDLSTNLKVYIVGAGDGSSVKSSLQSNGVNVANCTFINNSDVHGWWTRDYTGWFIADGNNKVGLVDFEYNRPYSNSDAIPTKQAPALNVSLYTMPVVHTGGNYMSDGLGVASSTDVLTSENSSLGTTQLNQHMKDYLGISNHMVVPDAQGEYIKHIDCWAKFLSVDKVLVDSVPQSDPRYNNYETAATYYKNQTCSWGYQYKVYRASVSGSSTSEPYANSFICNNIVYLGFKGNSYDNAGLNVYKKAMPGYTIKTYLGASSAPWLPTDALHCRTHEVPDRGMLYLNHMPLFGKQCSPTGYKISADAVSYAGNAIKSGYPKIVYKVNGGSWDSIPMTLVSGTKYEGTIPNQSNGTKVEYFVRGIDNSTGKVYNHPYIGAPDPHSFTVECLTSINPIQENATYLSTYPTINQGAFQIYVDNKKNKPNATLIIRNALGAVVHDQSFNLRNGVTIHSVDMGSPSKGIYFLEFRMAEETITQKIVVQ